MQKMQRPDYLRETMIVLNTKFDKNELQTFDIIEQFSYY